MYVHESYQNKYLLCVSFYREEITEQATCDMFVTLLKAPVNASQICGSCAEQASAVVFKYNVPLLISSSQKTI